MKKIFTTVGVFAVMIAAVVTAVLLGGSANAQFHGLRCDVDKPEGEYELCDAVADFDDLMPVEYGAYTLADGSVVDRWAVDEEYYGGEDFDYRFAKKGRYRIIDVYALDSGEVLLEVRRIFNCYEPYLPDGEVLAVGLEYYEKNPPYDLIGQLEKVYLELGRMKALKSRFKFKTVEARADVQLVDPKRWTIEAAASEYYIDTNRAAYAWKIHSESYEYYINTARTAYGQKRNFKELGGCVYTFDRKTGELLSEK